MSDEERDRLGELDQRRKISEGLHGILSALNSSEPLSAILDYVTASASRLLNADAVSVYQLNAEAQLLTIQSSRGLTDEYLAHSTLRLGQSATGQAVLTGKPVSIGKRSIRSNSAVTWRSFSIFCRNNTAPSCQSR